LWPDKAAYTNISSCRRCSKQNCTRRWLATYEGWFTLILKWSWPNTGVPACHFYPIHNTRAGWRMQWQRLYCYRSNFVLQKWWEELYKCSQ